MKNNVRYYSDYTDDFEISRQPKLEFENYKIIREDFISKALSLIVYSLAVFLSFPYCRFLLRMKIVNREKLKNAEGGYFIYANHTQPVGDVFVPAFCAFAKRIYTVVSTENYGIPFIGKILPYLGALPVINSVSGIKKLLGAVEYRIKTGHPVVIYPEAHVWQYYTGIRPFPDTSFSFPVKCNAPSFTVTSTYQRTKWRKRPKMTVYIDGPFFAEGETRAKKISDLANKVYNSMKENSKKSDYDYIKYIRK